MDVCPCIGCLLVCCSLDLAAESNQIPIQDISIILGLYSGRPGDASKLGWYYGLVGVVARIGMKSITQFTAKTQLFEFSYL